MTNADLINEIESWKICGDVSLSSLKEIVLKLKTAQNMAVALKPWAKLTEGKAKQALEEWNNGN